MKKVFEEKKRKGKGGKEREKGRKKTWMKQNEGKKGGKGMPRNGRGKGRVN